MKLKVSKSNDQGLAKAQYNLGLMYETGDDGRNDSLKKLGQGSNQNLYKLIKMNHPKVFHIKNTIPATTARPIFLINSIF